jgi:hypothetical protein
MSHSESCRKYYISHREDILAKAATKKEQKHQYDQRYNQINRDKKREQGKQYRLKHPEKVFISKHTEDYQRKAVERARRWRRENRELVRKQRREQFKEYPEVFLHRLIVYRMLKRTSCRKTSKSYQYLGCTPGFFRNHIEAQFLPGMSWENRKDWHIDHIVPLSWFPFDEDPSLLFVASHWTNLRPIWGKDNMRKGNRSHTT